MHVLGDYIYTYIYIFRNYETVTCYYPTTEIYLMLRHLLGLNYVRPAHK